MPISARPIALSLIALILPVMSHSQEHDPDPFYCGERELGRYFYCERERPQPKEETTQEVSPEPIQQSANQEIAAVREHLEELRAEAVLRPTPDAVRANIVYQREQLDRASTFSDAWRRLVWTEPALDYTLQRPVSQLGNRQWLDKRRQDRNRVLAKLGDRYGLFYLFAGSCPACIEFSPILMAFAEHHDIPVKAVSVDGGSSQYFPKAVVNSGQIETLGLTGAPTPAVVLFDSHTNQVIPVGFGIVSQSELEDRIFVLTQTQTGEDY